MATRLFVVEDTFSISGRGTVLTSGISYRELAGALANDHAMVKMGACIELRRPDGSSLATRITGMSMFGLPEHPYAVLVPLPKDQIPVGTEVWLAE